MLMETTEPVLYYSPGSCSLAVHIVLEEIGNPFRLEPVITDKGETRAPQFRRLNPKGRVPVLTKGDVTWTEAPAILMHLALSNPTRGLAPQGHDELIRTLEWFNWLSGTVHAVAIRQIWRPEYFSDYAAHHEAIIARGHVHLREAHLLIEERLASRIWAMQSGYTVLDPYLLVFYRWGNRMKLPMPTLFPHWTEHAKRALERDAVQRVLAREGISIWA
jgi:glutathione S-transferase